MNYVSITCDLWDSEGGIALRSLVARSHGQLKLIAASKLAWLPRLSISCTSEWLAGQPYEKGYDGAEVVALGTGEGPALFGKLSHLANAIHPVDSYEESSFTAIHIEKVNAHAVRPESNSKAPMGSDLNVPSITSGTKFLVLLNFLLFLLALARTLYIRSFMAALFLVLLGSTNSATGYLNRWEPKEMNVSSERVHERKRGDVMIYTNKGALILATCSTEVAEELYFKFAVFRKDLDSPHLILLGFIFTLSIWVGATMRLDLCDAEGMRIIVGSFVVTNAIEIFFGLLPSERRIDLSRYYWADITPKLTFPKASTKLVQKEDQKEDQKAAGDDEEKAEERSSSLPKKKSSWKFSRMFLLALVKAKDPRWVDALNILPRTGRYTEAKTVLPIAAIVMNTKSRKIILERLKSGDGFTHKGKQISLTDGGVKVLRHVLVAARSKLATRLATPDPSLYHIDSRTRQQGLWVRVLEIFQILFELCAGRQLSWYPLPEPERMYGDRQVRVYSLDPNNPQNTRFYHDIPTAIAEVLFDYPFSMVDADKTQWGWSMLGRPKVFLHGTSIMELLLDFFACAPHKGEKPAGHGSDASQADSLSQASQPSETEPESPSSGPPPKKIQLAPMDSESSSEGEDVGDSTSASPGENEDSDKNSLFICADIASHDSRAQVAKVGSNDNATIEELRRAYQTLSRKWPKIKRITGIRFFRFHCFLRREVENEHQLQVHIHKDKQRYPLESDPEYPEYHYSPKPWPTSLPFPVEEICWYFLHPEDCGTSSALNKMLPARVSSDLANHHRAFGIYIQERYSVWAIFVPVVILSCVILAATLWFVKDHTDDLQTAIVPFAVACSIGTLVVNTAVSLLLFRMLAP